MIFFTKYMFLGIACGCLPGFFIIFYAMRKAKKRKYQQNQILEKYKNKETLRIRYCSQKRFKTIWKMFPWEASGVLFVDDNKIICELCSNKGEKIDLDFAINDISLNWIGRKHWLKNGLLSWFIIEEKQGKHYFTSETGGLIIQGCSMLALLHSVILE